MTKNSIKHWGLTVPGRPPTPSDGHAQQYMRIGPEASQKVVSFDNGTSLSFGPDDLVDEFIPGDHPFINQIALIDTAIRDCKSVSNRYPGPVSSHSDSHEVNVYSDFRSRTIDTTTQPRVTLQSGEYVQVPSRFASTGTLISVYSSANNWHASSGGHPGRLSDVRFGVPGVRHFGRLQQHKTRKRRPLEQNPRHGQRRQRQVISADQKVEGEYGGGPAPHPNWRNPHTGWVPTPPQLETYASDPQNAYISNYDRNEALYVQNRQIQSKHHEFGDDESHMHKPQSGWSHQSQIQSPFQLAMPPEDYPVRQYPHRLAQNFLHQAFLAGVAACQRHQGHIPVHNYYEQADLSMYYSDDVGIGQKYNQEDYAVQDHETASHSNQSDDMQSQSSHMYSANNSAPTGNESEQMDVRAPGYSRPHIGVARQAGREFARYLDEMNQEQQSKGDNFAAEPVLNIEPPTPTVLSALVQSREGQARTTFGESPSREITGVAVDALFPEDIPALNSVATPLLRPSRAHLSGEVSPISNDLNRQEIDSTYRGRNIESSESAHDQLDRNSQSFSGSGRGGSAKSSVMENSSSRNSSLPSMNNDHLGKTIFGERPGSVSRDQSPTGVNMLRGPGRRLFDRSRTSSPGVTRPAAEQDSRPDSAGK